MSQAGAMNQRAGVQALAAELAAITSRPWTLMEVCGGQTHAIVRWGLDQLLPPGMRLIHGPGCPVCVTPAATIDAALRLARCPEVILCSYGDMLRVPGSASGDDLLGVRAAGGDVRLLTSPLQAIALARAHPERQVVFLAVGFETTAPATALLARQALALGLANLALLVAHVRVVPAMAAVLADPANQVQGFLAAGHVGAVMGLAELEALVAAQRVPVVVSGFEPLELMAGLVACVRQLEAGRAVVENAYGQVVRPAGNPAAQRQLAEVFAVVDQPWRGLGVLPG
ncbi:MAG: hydrogenase formation protein HypD, partial [Cyanobium sp.]